MPSYPIWRARSCRQVARFPFILFDQKKRQDVFSSARQSRSRYGISGQESSSCHPSCQATPTGRDSLQLQMGLVGATGLIFNQFVWAVRETRCVGHRHTSARVFVYSAFVQSQQWLASGIISGLKGRCPPQSSSTMKGLERHPATSQSLHTLVPYLWQSEGHFGHSTCERARDEGL